MVIAEAGRVEEVPTAVRLGVVLALGLVMGAVTSVLQKYLNFPWLSLVNAASPWLAPAFAVGALQRRVGGAAFAGLAACVFELVGYYLTSAARGYFSSGGHGILLFWTGCAVVGGPVFGAAGWLWRQDRVRGLGASVLAASFLAEAAISYGWRLHYTSSAILFAALGIGAAVLLGLRNGQYAPLCRWLLLTFPAGAVAELLLGLVYARSF
jgi:Family of unknown function (DUF6518)